MATRMLQIELTDGWIAFVEQWLILSSLNTDTLILRSRLPAATADTQIQVLWFLSAVSHHYHWLWRMFLNQRHIYSWLISDTRVSHEDLADWGFCCGWNVYYRIMCLAVLITLRMTMTRVSQSQPRVGGKGVRFGNFYTNSIESIECVGSGWARNGTWHFATCTRPNHPPTPQWLHKFQLFPNKIHF